MESIIRFNANKRGPYKPRVTAKANSHLLLKEEDRAELTEILSNNAPGVVEIRWNQASDARQRDQFFRENGLDLQHDDARCRWATRHSNPTKFVKQCISGSFRKPGDERISRESAVRYPYVGCLAFVTIAIRNGEVCGVAGYLHHSAACKASRPARDPVYRLLPPVRKSVENLLSLNVSSADILAQNARTVRIFYGGRTLIDNHRTLLTAQDISNIKNEMLRKNWDIDVRQDAAKNLERYLGPNASQTELKDACLHYQFSLRQMIPKRKAFANTHSGKCSMTNKPL